MGSKKYPKENEFDSFITSHGGFNNAYTAGLNTCYSLCVSAKHLTKALDIFAQFFTSPLLNPDAVNR